MTGSDGVGTETLARLETLETLKGFDECEVLEVFAGCAVLDAFRIWGAAIIEAFQSLVLVLAFPVT